MNKVEYTPEITPTIIAKQKPLMSSLPKKNITNKVNNTVIDVLIERPIVLFKASLMVDSI